MNKNTIYINLFILFLISFIFKFKQVKTNDEVSLMKLFDQQFPDYCICVYEEKTIVKYGLSDVIDRS